MKKSNTRNSDGFTPVAITGIGCIFPKSAGVKDYWRSLFCGIDCVTEVPETHWSPNDYYDEDPQKPDHVYCKRGGFIDSQAYDPSEFGIPPSILEATDSSQLLGLVAAKMALNDAGYGDKGKEFDRSRTSVILGATGTQELTIPLATRLGHPVWRKALNESGLPLEKTEEIINRISAGFVSWQENSFPGLLGNVVAGRIANRLDLGGTNCVVDAACGSSLGAVHLALLELMTGRSKMVITGGVDLLNDIFMHMCFSKTGVLSKTGDAKPFSEDADGTVLGEGLGMLVMKRLEDAEKDGDRIYAVIKGAGSSSDGKSQSIYAPSAKGQEKALKKAYETAGFGPETIDIVEAHGTGTRVGDAVEFSALKGVFSERKGTNQVALGSVKSMIGHTKAAAGAAGMIKIALSLHNKVIPPTLKISNPDPKLDMANSPFYLPSVSLPWFSDSSNPRRAGVSAFGFGGSNFHMAMEEYKKDKNEPSWDGSVEILAFSSDSKDGVLKELEHISNTLSSDPKMTSFLASESRKRFDSSKAFRLVVSSLFDKVSETLEKAKNMISEGEKEYNSRTGSAFYSEGLEKGKLAFIFPGQGSQYTGMARELSCIFPEMMGSIEKASSFYQGDKKLHELIYPRGGEEEANEAILRDTSVAQPAIGAISLGMMKILDRFGIKPDSVCGHSFGELTALACSGMISEDDLLKLAVLRGRYMAEAGKGGDAGTMLAVKAKLEDLESMIKETGVDVVLANRNSHDQGVLSGSAEAIEQAKQLCKERKMRGTQLSVAAAFHSRFVASAATPFSKELDKIEFVKGSVPVYANTTAEPYPVSVEEIRHLLGNQLVNSVNFVGIIEAMHKDGINTFIEAGPKTVLTGLVKAILKGRDFNCAATDDSSGKKPGLLDLATIISKIAALGHSVSLSKWETDAPEPKKPRMNIPISGANYRNPEKIIKFPVSEQVMLASSDKGETRKPEAKYESKPQAVSEVKSPAVNIAKEREIVKDASISVVPPLQKIDSNRFQNEKTRPVAIKGNSSDVAVRSITEGFKAMQNLQMQTTEAHKKFLDTQLQASKTLETLMQKIGEISGSSSIPASSFSSEAHVRQAEAPRYAERSVQSERSIVIKQSADLSEPQKKQTENVPVSRPESKAEKKIESLSPSTAIDTEKLKSVLLEVVSNLTGYPSEMLDLDMDIESDLGIDSIKRVEILSSFEEKMPGAGNIDPSDLGRLKTLGQIIEHISKTSPASSPKIAETSKSSSQKSSQGSDKEAVKKALLEVVSGLTGYPEEMLDLDMDIESDLGIDSIKRVEILSAFEEKMPGTGNVDPSDLGRLKTLGQIIDYIMDKNPASAYKEPASITPASSSSTFSREAIREVLIDVVSSLTGYPSEMLDLDMDIESDLGIDSIKRVEILSAFEEKMPGAGNVDPSDLGRLKTLGQIIDHLDSLNQTSGAQEKSPNNISASSKPAPTAVDSERISEVLIEVVSSLTGYPSEMLDLDMDIESDLGIDSIKRVEILSAFEEKMPGMPQIQPDELGRLKTLGQIINQIINHKKGLSSESFTSSPEKKDEPIIEEEKVQAKDLSLTPGDISRKIVSVHKESFSAADLNSERISLPENGVLYLTGDVSGLGKELAAELKGLGVKTSIISLEDAAKKIESASGLVIISGSKTDSGVWDEEKVSFVKKAFLSAKNSSLSLVESGKSKGAVFATVTRIDGAFGFLTSSAGDPLQGALAGLSKTARIEWPEVSCRAFDVSPFITDLKKTASVLAAEILSKGPAETGMDDNNRYVPELVDVPFSKPEKTFSKKDVVVITGGAKGVTAACAEALAELSQPVMILLGRSPEPETEPSWLKGIKEEPAMKKAILENEFSGKKVSPQELEKSFRRLKGAREITETLDSIKNKGSKAAYFQADVRNHSDMESVIEKVRAKYGPVSAVIHGAGVLEDRFISDKTLDQFDNVFGTKTEGLKNLLDVTRNDPLKAIVLFSSVSARMGNKGQVDYAMANEVLNKIAVHEASKRPATRVVSINWGPWDGGMVSPSLKKEFNRQGIELIPLRSGALAMVSEMCQHPGSGHEGAVEVVIGAEFRHEEKKENNRKGKTSSDFSGIRINAGINEYPVLKDHMISGKAVVPVALMAEWFGHAALISSPGLHFHGLEDLRVLNGIKLGQETIEIRISSSKPVKTDGVYRLELEIRSLSETGSERIHARATALLGQVKIKAAESTEIESVVSEGPLPITAEAMYDLILFHGNMLKGITEIRGMSSKGMTAKAVTAPIPSEWIDKPLRKKWVSDPLLMDSAFQMASAWCYMNFGKVSLPSYAGKYIQYAEKMPEGAVEISMNTRSVSGSRMMADFAFKSENGTLISEIKGFESVMDLSLNLAFKKEGIKLNIQAPADLN